jgi:hypothetical protein
MLTYEMTLYIILHFVVAMISDIVLNMSRIVPSLNTYFNHKSTLVSAIYAGITITVALLLTMVLSKLILNIIIPDTIPELINYSILAFILGYVIDIFIDKTKLFGSDLNQYYKTVGSGFWGGSALVLSIVISYIIQKYVYYIIPAIEKEKDTILI